MSICTSTGERCSGWWATTAPGRAHWSKSSAASSGRTAGGSSSKAERSHFHSVKDARAAGIETVYQDLALVPQLTVYENLFLNREITGLGRVGVLSRRRMRSLCQALPR